MKYPAEKIITSCERRSLFHTGTFRSRSLNLLFVEDGTLTVSFGRQSFQSALSVFFTEEAIRLDPEGVAGYTLLRLDPLPVYMHTGSGDLFLHPVTSFPGLADQELKDCIREAAQETVSRNVQFSLSISILSLRILKLFGSLFRSTVPLPEPLVPLTAHRASLYRNLLRWIRDHAEDGITLYGSAEQFGITPQYLGRFLKETTGMTFRGCLLDAQNAKKQGLAHISSRTGGASEEAPGERVSSAGEQDSADVLLPGTHFLRATLEPEHILPQHFRSLVNLGYARNLRILDVDSALDFVQGEIGFIYGRICRITDLIRTNSVRGHSYYDFTAVFSLLDSLVSHGITPFLELGNKSLLIQETTSISYTPVSPTDTKEYYQQLLSILPDFARACINHYGQSAFDKWYFEISYMYTSDEERESFGLVQYAGMFRKIYQLLRSFSPGCRIGGPGFNDWSGHARIRQMIRLMSSHGITPDFYSAYIYPVNSGPDGTMHLSEDPEEGLTRMKIFAETVHDTHPDREIWITEFNSNLSSRNYLNDLPYQAAYIARIMTGILPLCIDAIGYYLLSDAPLRYLDSLDFLFGGWGLLTDRGIPKPSFHAFRIMDKLGHYLVRTTGSCLITANSRGSFQILLYRYQHPKKDFLYRNVEKEDLSVPRAVFENAGRDLYDITIDNVLRGTYIVKEYRIGARRSDLFSAWRELDFLFPSEAATLNELRLKSALVPHIRVCRLEEGEPFQVTLELSDTELILITVNLYASRT